MSATVDMTNEQSKKYEHLPVMVEEVQSYLDLNQGDCYVDCTLGLAGHAKMMSEIIGSTGRMIGIDRDDHSLALAREQLMNFSGQLDLWRSDFRQLHKILDDLQVRDVDGMLFDLGISSYQLDNPERGFSFRFEGPLDMRMDQNAVISAHDIINSLSETEISSILFKYGQERWHHRIAKAIVHERQKNPIVSTQELAEVIKRAIPGRFRDRRIHPATRSFQAIRIAVNRELEAVEAALDRAFDYVKKGGRVCVISFHSLEDRIVKEKFRQLAKLNKAKLLTKKPIRPQEKEVVVNPRARSARLRAVEKLV